MVEVVDQSSDPFDEKIVQRGMQILPSSPTATSPSSQTQSASQTSK